MMYPLDLPPPPHDRPTRLLCGPSVAYSDTDGGAVLAWEGTLGCALLPRYLEEVADTLFTLMVPAPRTAERAFWSHVMDCEAELVMSPPELVLLGHPKEWWADYNLDQRAEEAIARRG